VDLVHHLCQVMWSMEMVETSRQQLTSIKLRIL